MADDHLTIAITGSTGLIGEALIERLLRAGHRVRRVVRDRRRASGDDIYWSVAQGEIDAEELEGTDAVVHLAGEPIGANRWTAEVKQRIRDSRVHGTRLLSEALASLDRSPSVLLSQSAVGYYGDRGEEILTENDAPGEDFFAQVCSEWEAAADPARQAGIRVVHPRTGVIIAEDGPLIEKVELPFKLGVGGRVGSGRQYVPWISLEDETRALEFLLEGDLDGPVNLTAPEPVTNAEMTQAIGEVLHRPTILPIPVFALRLLYGEMGESLASVSQRVVPRRLLDAGFRFEDTDIRAPLRRAFDR